jgi:flagellar motor switch protein FliN/FliY
LSTATPVDSAADLLSPAAADQVMAVEELEQHTQLLAQRVATALAPSASAAGMELAAGPADVQDGAADLLPPGTVHGLIARVRDAAAVQVVLILDQSLAGTGAAPGVDPRDPAAAELPEPWMAPLAAAMETWATELGGVLVNAMPVADADQLQHLLVGSSTTTLTASGLFAGTSLVGSVAVVGRTSVEQAPSAAPTTRAGMLTGADALTGGQTPAGAATPHVDGTRRTASAALDAMHVLAEVEMQVTAELGRTRMSVSDLLALTPGSLIELDRTAGSPIDLLVNGTLIGRGEVVVVDEEYGIRLTEITGSES